MPATATAPQTLDVDLFADDVLLDPYPLYAELRELAAVVHLVRNDVYAVTRYEPIRAGLADWKVFSSASVAFNDDMNAALAGTSLAADPPLHTSLRAALSENLSPRAVRGLKGDIDAKADAMVAGLVEQGSFDAIDDLARAFPISIVCDLIGVTGSVKENMLRWGEAAFNVLGPMNQRTIDNFPVAGELFSWCMSVKAVDLTPGSIGRGVFDAADRGLIPHEAAAGIIHQYVAAGLDTTIASIGNAIALLGEHPDQYARLRRDPTLIGSAFNEVLRYWSAVHAWGRHVNVDVEIDGVTIPGGSQAAFLFGAGNRDPRHYRNPDEFDITRNPTDHLSFGYGPHSCAGQALAKLEAHAVLAALVRHVESFECGPQQRVISNSTRSIDSLQITSLVPTRQLLGQKEQS